jgi:hypothetical protein
MSSLPYDGLALLTDTRAIDILCDGGLDGPVVLDGNTSGEWRVASGDWLLSNFYAIGGPPPTPLAVVLHNWARER